MSLVIDALNDLDPPGAGFGADHLKKKGYTTFYHGTSTDNVDSIKKSGIRSEAGEPVSVSLSRLEAGRWGEMKYPGKPVSVFKLDLGKSMHNLKGPDFNTIYRHDGDIPSHAIRGVFKHNIVD
jgi:hypothetical protein